MRFDHLWKDNVFGFNEQLIASNGVIASCDVREILRARLPGCVDVQKTDTEKDRCGVDWLAFLANGRRVGVDLKSRTKDCQSFGNDDVALETWSVVNRKVGWSRDDSKTCDWILWIWGDTGRFFLMPFAPVCAVFSERWQEWRQEYGPKTQLTRQTKTKPGWQSECVFVPRKVLVESVLEWSGGFVGQEA